MAFSDSVTHFTRQIDGEIREQGASTEEAAASRGSEMFTGVVLEMSSLQGRLPPPPCYSQRENRAEKCAPNKSAFGAAFLRPHRQAAGCLFSPRLHVQMDMKTHAPVKGLVTLKRHSDLWAADTSARVEVW